MKVLKLLPLLILIVSSCSSSLERPYTKSTLETDIVELKKTLSEEEIEILAGYIVMKSMDNETLLGKTYADLLEEAMEIKAAFKKQEEEEKQLAEQAKIDEARRIKRLGEALTVGLFDKGYMEYKYQEYITYKFVFQNKSDKDIKAFKGKIVVKDLFDKEITSFELTYDDGILANSTKNWNAQTDFNQFKDEDVTLKNKDVGDLKISWIPAKIIFTDESTIE